MTSQLTPILSSPGWDILTSWENRPERAAIDPLTLGTMLRAQGISAEIATAVASQLALRDAAEAKFGLIARTMVFTREGLEQASRLLVATLHADRFRAAGITHLADLGCGIGTESLAAAGLGLDVTAFDIDEDAVGAAAVNLRHFPNARVARADVTDIDLADLVAEGVDGIFADPARRKGSTRIKNPQNWSPPLSTVLSWRDTIPALGVKMAPGIDHSALPADTHVQWVSIDGDLVEAALWTPPLAPEGPGRSAHIIRDGRAHILTDPALLAANERQRLAPHGKLGAFLAEADDAVIRAGLLATLAESVDGHLIDPKIAYITADSLEPSPFMRIFDVLEECPLRPKAIRPVLKRLGISDIEVKKRGADIDPSKFRSAILGSSARKGAGASTGEADADNSGVVFATRIQGQHRAIIARRADRD
ncbi:MAG: class I SAM-dependent methyltransferase [Actinomycetaceae bacterium]|nr:class I SAM-dependent methyltransferase [Actinomycetaceae bacterium]